MIMAPSATAALTFRVRRPVAAARAVPEAETATAIATARWGVSQFKRTRIAEKTIALARKNDDATASLCVVLVLLVPYVHPA